MHDAILITADKGFANIFEFKPGTHKGIIVVRVPDDVPSANMNREILNGLAGLQGEDLTRWLVVIEVGRVRIRRPG